MSLKITPRQNGDVTILDLSGRATLGEAAMALRDTIRDHCARGNNKLLLNCGDLSYMDSVGSAELLSAFTHVRSNGGVIKLENPGKQISDILQITGFHRVFESFNNEAAAVRSFSPPSPCIPHRQSRPVSITKLGLGGMCG